MLLLAHNVCFDPVQIRLANAEVRIASLPFEAGKITTLLLQPLVGNPFQFLDPFRLRNRAAKPRNQ